jgi:hypothetical protein
MIRGTKRKDMDTPAEEQGKDKKQKIENSRLKISRISLPSIRAKSGELSRIKKPCLVHF